MKIISHRGNLFGADAQHENSPLYIKEAQKLGFDVEIDVWYHGNKYFLGHDEPVYEIDENFFNDKMWIHCKNLEAVERLNKTHFNWFWHEGDKMTLTSEGHIWCYSGIFVNDGIVVECGKPFQISKNVAGICTDYPIAWSKMKMQENVIKNNGGKNEKI